MTQTTALNVRQTAAEHTQILFGWAAKACDAPLPTSIRRRAATILADDIGAMVAGSLEPQVALARQGFVGNSSPVQESTVLAAGAACVANGINPAIHPSAIHKIIFLKEFI